MRIAKLKMKYNKVSIIIPVYNEEKYVEKLIKIVDSQRLPLKKELIIVDDYSTDNTRKILKKLEKKYKIIYHKKNGGKGTAVRTGLRHASGDIFIVQDADLEYDPSEYNKLLNPILDYQTQVVYGSRFKSGSGHLKENDHLTYLFHRLGNKFLTGLTNILFFSSLTDMETCYKLFTREVYNKILPLRASRFDLEPELTAKILKRKFKIKEIPIRYHSRDFNEGKKITWKDGVKAVYYLFKYRIID